LSEGVLDCTSSLKLAKATPQMGKIPFPTVHQRPAHDYGGDFGIQSLPSLVDEGQD
jgi:hypothetical protein